MNRHARHYQTFTCNKRNGHAQMATGSKQDNCT